MNTLWHSLVGPTPRWFLICEHSHFGDLYHVCSLLHAFKGAHGFTHPITLVLGNETHREIASLFSEHFNNSIMSPGLPKHREDWIEFFLTTELSIFGVDVPILTHPIILQDMPPDLLHFAAENGLSWMQIMKRVLRLPADAQPTRPNSSENRRIAADAFCQKIGVRKGRAAILFPYARTFAVNAGEHFGALVEVLGDAGYQVFTSVSGDELPINGTAAIHIPFSILSEVVEYAGWMISARSGVDDIASAARCRKDIFYPDLKQIRIWGMKALGLEHNAFEHAFDFRIQSPTDFIKKVEGFGIQNLRNHSVKILSCSEKFMDISADQQSWNETYKLPLRIHDVPMWSDPHWGLSSGNIDQAVEILRAKSSIVIAACNDQSDLCYFEPLSIEALKRGNYHAASSWHSISIFDTNTDYQSILKSSILPIENVAVGEDIRFFHATKGPGHISQSLKLTPFFYKGLNFCEGWSAFDSSGGIWTVGHKSALSISLARDRPQKLNIILSIVPAISDKFPVIDVTIVLNRRETVTRRLCKTECSSQVEFAFLLETDEMEVFIEFEFGEVQSPRTQVNVDDDRLLGFFLHHLRIDGIPDC